MSKLTAKQVLKEIDAMAAGMEPLEAKKLWDVLSALRGPDAELGYAKRATTEQIRRRSLPKLAGKFVAVAPNAREVKEPWAVEARGEISAGHFRQHAYAAFDALGLKW